MYLREKYRRPENAYPRAAKATSGLRSFNPTLGRFVSRDPIAELGGPNVYVAVKNDPGNRADPHGKLSFATQVEPESSKTDCGGFSWQILWEPHVDDGEKDGYVVQKITLSDMVFTCDGREKYPPKIKIFWELWHVFDGVPKYKNPQGVWAIGGDQWTFEDRGSDTKGITRIWGEAIFYDGPPEPPNTPSDFTMSPVDSLANGLPWKQDTAPYFWPGNGDRVVRFLIVRWKCCCEDGFKTIVRRDPRIDPPRP